VLPCGTNLNAESRGTQNHGTLFAESAAHDTLNELVADALRYRASTEFARLLRFIRGFRSYKPFNALLVDIQKRGSTFVAPAGRWRSDYRRHVAVDAQPLVILQPFGPVMFVFDVSDTEPEPGAPELPLEVTHPFEVLTAASERAVTQAMTHLTENAIRDGVRTTDVDAGTQWAGAIGETQVGGSQLFQIAGRPTPRFGQIPIRYDMKFNSRQTGLTRYATLTHELAHLYCGHIGTPNEKWWPDTRYKDQRTAEFEAETASSIAVGRLDPTAALPPYLAQYLAQESQVPEGLNLERIMKTAGLLADMSAGRMKPRPA
jgi:hypothetical protein